MIPPAGLSRSLPSEPFASEAFPARELLTGTLSAEAKTVKPNTGSANKTAPKRRVALWAAAAATLKTTPLRNDRQFARRTHSYK
jgi:hypothetical protein